MAAAERKQKDQSMAQYMKDHPGQFPDSEMRPHNGCGSDARKMALSMGRVLEPSGAWYRGMLGGVIAHRAGLASKQGIPASLL